MSKAKREASARADELLKSYDVKLNPLLGTYRLADKTTGKEVNVERSGVDVGTGILAKGRRMNKLIGKNLVQKGVYSSNENRPIETAPKKAEVKTVPEVSTVSIDKGTPNNVPLMLRGLPNQQEPYSWSLPKPQPLSTIVNNTESNSISKPVPIQAEPFIGAGSLQYGKTNNFVGAGSLNYGTNPIIPGYHPSNSVESKPSKLQMYHKFRYNMLSMPLKNHYKTPEEYGKSLPFNEESEEVVNYAINKAQQDARDAQLTKWEQLKSMWKKANSAQANLLPQYQYVGRIR